MEALLHIEGTGDCRVPAEGWIGSRGRKLRLEAFSLRPLETFAPGEMEYKAYGPNGRETPWISGGKLCGTRGRGLPLTGFAVRLAADRCDRFGIEYQGAFFESGDVGPTLNGSPCMALLADDPLEAMNLRLFERAAR
jgi:Clostridial hydrophobic W